MKGVEKLYKKDDKGNVKFASNVLNNKVVYIYRTNSYSDIKSLRDFISDAVSVSYIKIMNFYEKNKDKSNIIEECEKYLYSTLEFAIKDYYNETLNNLQKVQQNKKKYYLKAFEVSYSGLEDVEGLKMYKLNGDDGEIVPDLLNEDVTPDITNRFYLYYIENKDRLLTKSQKKRMKELEDKVNSTSRVNSSVYGVVNDGMDRKEYVMTQKFLTRVKNRVLNSYLKDLNKYGSETDVYNNKYLILSKYIDSVDEGDEEVKVFLDKYYFNNLNKYIVNVLDNTLTGKEEKELYDWVNNKTKACKVKYKVHDKFIEEYSKAVSRSIEEGYEDNFRSIKNEINFEDYGEDKIIYVNALGFEQRI